LVPEVPDRAVVLDDQRGEPAGQRASQTCGESQCTCVSTPPGVTIRPGGVETAVPVSSTTSTPSIVSGLPARPTATTRPSLTPIDA
jgi:CxxC motif-containing protein (DUF1111 family)